MVGQVVLRPLQTDRVHQSKEEKQAAYEQFLMKSRLCVETMINGFNTGKISVIQKQITKNRQLLAELSSLTGVVIETEALKNLCDLAESYTGAAKSSGAGGGDCGIVIFRQKSGILPLMTAWEKDGITPLPLHVYTYGQKECKEKHESKR